MKQDLFAHKALLDEWLSRRPRCHSSFSFVNVFLWQEHFDFEFAHINGRLCVFAMNAVGAFLYLPPLGKEYDEETVTSCFARMREKNRGQGVSRIENVAAGELEIFPEDKFSVFHKGYEYLYYRAELVALQGEDYKSRRHDCNHFLKHHAPKYQPFELLMQGDCLNLYERWAQERRRGHNDPVYQHMLSENRGVHRLGMEYFKELGLVGRVVYVEGQLAAYTFGYALTDDIFCVLFEVADLSFQGLPAYLFTEFCRDPEVAGFKFINVMDDFGVKNLEQAKLSFRPAVLVPAYAVSERG